MPAMQKKVQDQKPVDHKRSEQAGINTKLDQAETDLDSEKGRSGINIKTPDQEEIRAPEKWSQSESEKPSTDQADSIREALPGFANGSISKHSSRLQILIRRYIGMKFHSWK